MPKVKIIFGIKFSISPSSTNDELENYYSKNVKPFIESLLVNKNAKGVVYFCGTLLEFITKKHKESIIVIKELYKEKRLEILACGYYEPILQFIDSTHITSQIDKLTILIKDNITGKRANGFWLNNGVWEPSFPSLLDKVNIKYSFLSDLSFKYSGVDVASLFQIFITEDKGKTILLFPIIENLSISIGKVDVVKYYENICELQQTNKDNIVTVFIDDNDIEKDWLNSFFDLVSKNNDIDFYLPNKLIKDYDHFKKVYIPSTCDRHNAGKMFYNGQRENYEMVVKQFENSDIMSMINRGSFRNFLTKYIEANRIYSRVRITTDEIKFSKNKLARKEALPYLLKAQTSYALSFNKELGIYKPENRQYCYKNLINAEKIIREKGQIQTYIKKYDFNNDGLEEILFTGNHLKAFISKKGASLFELDYYPISYNYLNTICDYREHNDASKKTYEKRKSDTFQDIIIYTDTKGKEFIKDLSEETFELLEIKTKKNIIKFKTIINFGNKIKIKLVKQYTLKKNTVEILYSYINLSEQQVDLQIITEINLSFPEYKKNVEVYNCHEKQERVKPAETKISNCTHLKFLDLLNKSLINLHLSNPAELSHKIFESQIAPKEKIENIYQYTSFKPIWSIKLDSGKSKYWQNEIKLNLTKQ